MLDIVSNSLAAVIILFFILSALRIPSIPIERICGTGEVIVKIFDSGNNVQISQNIDANIFIRPKIGDAGNSIENMEQMDSIYWSDNIDKLNTNFSNFQQIFPSCNLEEDEIKLNNLVSISRVLKKDQNPNDAQQHITFRNPPANFSFDIGTLYNNHNEIDRSKKPIRIEYEIIWKEENSEPLTTQKIDTILEAPTGRVYLNIDWKSKKITPEKLIVK